MHDRQAPASILALPADFTFSQSALQTYEDCPRRFWLTYVERLPWPAVQAAPIQEHETLLRLGEVFHRLVQRAEIGLDPDLLAVGLPDPLDLWFESYRRYRPADLPPLPSSTAPAGGMVDELASAMVEIEYSLTVPLLVTLPSGATATVRLTALYDLLMVEPRGRAVILDWKTTRRRPDAAIMRRRLQSQVYPFVLVEASRHLPWGPLDPQRVEMRYWYTAAPDQPITLDYDRARHEESGRRLHRLLAEILTRRTAADFPMIEDTEANRLRACRFCVYRTRCDRGVTPGPLDALIHSAEWDSDDLSDLTIDLEDIPELAF